jgi:hypothetical protein
MGSSDGLGLSTWLSKGELRIYVSLASGCMTHSHGLGGIRFQRWVEHLPPPSKLNTLEKFVRRNLPPLDVWMVLHAYLLNPQSVRLTSTTTQI